MKRARERDPVRRRYENKLTPEQARARRLLKYGLSVKEYDALLEQQGGVCHICKHPPSGSRRLAVDHDHQTGIVRGLLCSLCNTALGLFRDDQSRLSGAIKYLA